MTSKENKPTKTKLFTSVFLNPEVKLTLSCEQMTTKHKIIITIIRPAWSNMKQEHVPIDVFTESADGLTKLESRLYIYKFQSDREYPVDVTHARKHTRTSSPTHTPTTKQRPY